MVTESNYGNLGIHQPFAKKVTRKQSQTEKLRDKYHKSHHATKLPSYEEETEDNCNRNNGFFQNETILSNMQTGGTWLFFMYAVDKIWLYVVNGKNENLCN